MTDRQRQRHQRRLRERARQEVQPTRGQTRRWIAFHEAGHVVAAYRDGIGVNGVTLRAHDQFIAHVDFDRQPDLHVEPGMSVEDIGREAIRAHNLMVVSLAGVHAGYRAAGRPLPPLDERLQRRETTALDDWPDHDKGLRVAQAFGTSLGAAEGDAAELIATAVGWAAITAVAEALLARGALTRADIDTILAPLAAELAHVGA
ncbi:MAG TPA: hypothetical protein VFB50_12365 [Chloroflexota bacterium]|nr:hypothetical protein [Chloroflexota bacterium]